MKLQLFGEYVFEFFVTTILLIISLVLVIPFPFMIVGVRAYFSNDIYTRRYKDIFICIKENFKILSLYAIFEILIIVVSSLNVFYLNTHLEEMNEVILVVSYMALIFGVIYLITAPTIIVNMNVNFKQLIVNGFLLLFGNLKNTIIAVLVVVGFLMLVLYFPYIVIFCFYLASLILSSLMKENFYVLKARALGISVEELKRQRDEEGE